METQVLTPQVKDQLFSAKLPESTKSYKPIGHQQVYELVAERLDKEGLNIVNERFNKDSKGDKMFAELSVSSGSTDLRMAVGFRNSYDKSMPVGFVSGAQVIVCTNLMLEGEVKEVRKHTVNLKRDLDDKLDAVISNLEQNFQRLENDINVFKEVELPEQKAQELFGKILMHHPEVASINQVTKAIQNFKEPLHDFGNQTYWGFYNAFNEGFKDIHPYIAARNYLNLQKFVKEHAN